MKLAPSVTLLFLGGSDILADAKHVELRGSNTSSSTSRRQLQDPVLDQDHMTTSYSGLSACVGWRIFTGDSLIEGKKAQIFTKASYTEKDYVYM